MAEWTGQPAYWKGLACHQTPDDLWNLAELVWQVGPSLIVEVGPGDGGTSTFLRTLGGAPVTSVDLGQPVPATGPNTLVMLDGNVYSQVAMFWDLETYGPKAQWLVVCHTVRPDWGSAHALVDWWAKHPEWERMSVRHPTRHTWLKRV